MFKKRIYLDYAALTPVDRRVLQEIKKYSSPGYGNPSALYKEGVAAKKALEESRTSVASFLHAHGDEIVFTSGGTEANGLALEGAGRTAHRNGNPKPHLIISAIEHSSIIETAAMMEKQGVEVTRLLVDSAGLISLDDLKNAIKPTTYMVSVMTVNNEIGTIEPIYEAMKIVRRSRTEGSRYPLFHTDAAQAVLYEDLNMEKLGVDLLTLDASKAYGPRGMGCLYVRRGTPIEQIMYGGGQERGLRSGTENVPAITGFARALDIAAKEREAETKRMSEFRTYFIEKLRTIRSDIVINADSISRSPHILNVSIPGIDNEFFVLQLDAKGIACSTKSSCLRDEDESYVLKAIDADSKTSVRFSFGRWTKKGEIDKALKIIATIVEK